MEWARLTEGAHASCVRFAGIPARSTNTGEMPVNRSLEGIAVNVCIGGDIRAVTWSMNP